MYCSFHFRWAGAAALVVLTISHGTVSTAPSRCEQVLFRFNTLVDVTCTESADLTTANPVTTPANNAIAALHMTAGVLVPLDIELIEYAIVDTEAG